MKKLTKYAKKEVKYLKCFFQMVYEIAMAVDDDVTTSDVAVEMIHTLIDPIEDLTCETPIQDYEKDKIKYATEFALAQATYIDRESDLKALLTKFKAYLREDIN